MEETRRSSISIRYCLSSASTPLVYPIGKHRTPRNPEQNNAIGMFQLAVPKQITRPKRALSVETLADQKPEQGHTNQESGRLWDRIPTRSGGLAGHKRSPRIAVVTLTLERVCQVKRDRPIAFRQTIEGQAKLARVRKLVRE